MIDIHLGHTDVSVYLGLGIDVVSGIFSGSHFLCVVIELIIIRVFSIVLRERWMHVRKKDWGLKIKVPIYSIEASKHI